MKKPALAILFSALAVATSAQANWYVQGDLGYSKVKTSGLEYGEVSKTGFTPSVGVGYDFGDWRLALDYTKYRNMSYSYLSPDVSEQGTAKAQGLGVSAIYDINLNSAVEPFVGVRLATNYVKFNKSSVKRDLNTTYVSSNEDKNSEFGYGVLAGVSYKLDANLTAQATVEYNRLGKFEAVKLNQYGAKVGLRYQF